MKTETFAVIPSISEKRSLRSWLSWLTSYNRSLATSMFRQKAAYNQAKSHGYSVSWWIEKSGYLILRAPTALTEK